MLRKFFNKSQSKGSNHMLSMRRTSSEQIVTRDLEDVPSPQPPEEAVYPCKRNRASTFTNGISRPSRLPSYSSKKSSGSEAPIEEKIMEQLSQFSSPRHLQRRKAVVDDDIGLSLKPQVCVQPGSSSVLVCLEDGENKIEDTALVNNTHSLRDIVEMLVIKNDITLSHENLDDYCVSVSFQDTPVRSVTLDQPSAMLAGHTVEVRPKVGVASESKHREIAKLSSQPSQEFNTVADCLAYFSDHGLVELPLPHSDDPDTYHLPRVQPIDQIVGSWSELPIDPEKIEALTKKEREQQLALWEFIYTEHSHLRQLEIVINVFMRCLELIRRNNLLSEDNYHNMFGYMEDIYNAHDQFWTWTLEPALEKVYESGFPLDLNEIISRFPEFGAHFEIYEQHCQLEALNLHSLKKAKENPDFAAYLEWCESQPECHRLGLDQFLATPMQRLTRYPLLVSAIIKKTAQPHLKQRLEHLCEEMQEFVQCVNSGIQIQEETERVRDAMNRITGFQVVDVPSDLKDLVHRYTHLDLLAPMTGVEVDRSRVLMLEGALKYTDASIKSKMIPLHLFLFTDMLLVTKLVSRKGGDKYTIIREPYKIDRLILQSLEPGSFGAVVLNEFQVVSSWFILKANSPQVASQWMDQITTAQHFYAEAVDRRTQQWKLLQNLQNERILNGIEGKESLSTSLWAISPSSRSAGSSESLTLKRTSSPTINPITKKRPLTRTRSEDQAKKLHRNVQSEIFRPTFQSDAYFNVPKSAMSTKSPSLDRLLEHPEVPAKLRHSTSQSRLAVSQICLPSFKQSSEESLTASIIQQIPASPLSEDSGTESGGTISADGLPERSRMSPSMYRVSSDSTQEGGSPPNPSIAEVSQSKYLKPILRLTKSKEEAQSGVTSGSLNRTRSDDSGIAVKPQSSPDLKELSSSLDSRDGLQSPSFIHSPKGQASMPMYIVQPHSKSKVTFRSQSDSTLRFGTPPRSAYDAFSPIPPVDELKLEVSLTNISELSSPSCATDSTVTSPADLCTSEDIHSPSPVNLSTSESVFSAALAASNEIHSPSPGPAELVRNHSSSPALLPRSEDIHSPSPATLTASKQIHSPSRAEPVESCLTSPSDFTISEDIQSPSPATLTTNKQIHSPSLANPPIREEIHSLVESDSNLEQIKPAGFSSEPNKNPSSDSKTKVATKHTKPPKVPPPVTKKPLKRSSAVYSTAALSNSKANTTTNTGTKNEQPKVPGGRRRSVVGDNQPAGGRRRSVVGDNQPAGGQPVSSLKKKPSQLRKPSVTIKESRVSVKEVRQKFESAEKSSTTKPTVGFVPRSRKLSHPANPPKASARLPTTHSRSKSAVTPSDLSTFTRHGAVRAKNSSKTRTQPRTLPKRSPTHQAKQSGSVTRSASTITAKDPLSRSSKTNSFDETILNTDQDKEMLAKLSALSPQSSPLVKRTDTKLPMSSKRLSGLHNTLDTRIGIELDGESERGIDVPLNLNSNNNNAVECKKPEERTRKPSTYIILDAVTVKIESGKKFSSLPHSRKLRDPIEWRQFGGSRKQPCTLAHGPLSNTDGLRTKHLVPQHI